MKQKVWLLVLLTLAECARPVSRENVGSLKKESRPSRFSNSKPRAVSSRQRSEVFENLMNVYDPSFLAVVWPRISNGVHLFVEPACWDHLGVFFKDLADGRAWAYRAVDSSGRYRSGLFQGNRFWLGSKQECQALDDSFTSKEAINETAAMDEFQNREYLNAILRRDKYFNAGSQEWRSLVRSDELMRRLVAADHRPPFSLQYSAVALQFNVTKVTLAESYDVILGVCLPRSCRTEDIQSVINFSIMINDHFKSNKSLPRSLKITSLRPIERYYDITSDIGGLILIFVTVILVAIAVIATIVDLKLIKCRRRRGKAMSFDLQRIDTYNNLSRVRSFNKRQYDYLNRKNLVDLESLTKNMNKPNNINMVSVKKVTPNISTTPSISLDLDVSMDRITGSCKRCGKYKKQCNNNTQSPRFQENLPACPRVKSIASLTIDHTKQESFCKSILLSFSLRHSWRKIFNTNMANKDLSAIHLLKIVSVFWIIFVHVAMIANYASEDGGDINNHNNAFYILATGTLAFDTLFFASGIFSAHHYLFIQEQYANTGTCSSVCAHILQLVCFILNRAIRLLPPYSFAMFLSALVSRVALTTRAVVVPDSDHESCNAYWWRNLLYVTNAFPEQQQCMQISWYMSVETQLHCVAATCCALSHGRATMALVAVALLATTAADLATAHHTHIHFSNVYAAYGSVIARPLSRVTPYFLGVFTGWLIHRMGGRIPLSKSRSSLLWTCSTLSLLASAAIPWLNAGWAASSLHAIWPSALIWPALVLATTYAASSCRVLTSPMLSCLSRMSYCMLLAHGPIASTVLLHDGPTSSHTMAIWSYFAGTCLLTVAGALLLSLLVETPCCTLYRRLADRAT